MFVLRFGGKPRDYAVLAILIAAESTLAWCLAAPSSRDVVSLAYIDPGVGAMIVQAIAAAFFGALFYFKNLRRAIGRFFMKLAGKEPAPAQVEAPAVTPEKK
jgi:hypothetical protein